MHSSGSREHTKHAMNSETWSPLQVSGFSRMRPFLGADVTKSICPVDQGGVSLCCFDILEMRTHKKDFNPRPLQRMCSLGGLLEQAAPSRSPCYCRRRRKLQQSPSGSLGDGTWQAPTSAEAERAFFCALVRVAVSCSTFTTLSIPVFFLVPQSKNRMERQVYFAETI